MPNERWCSDVLEIACFNGEVVHLAFALDCCDREAVFLATVSCLQHNPRIRAHYDRLIQREDRPLTKMQAIGACMNKLLLYAFAVMKRREGFDSSHHWQRQEHRQVA